MADTFRILHLSDLHFGEPPRNIGFPDMLTASGFPNAGHALLSPASYDPNLAERVARRVSLLRQQVDVIFIGGDLATNGTPGDMALAQSFVDDPVKAPGWWNANKSPSIRYTDGPPIILMPGNHDRFSGIFYSAGGVLFDKVFAAYWNGSTPVNTLIVLRGTNGESLAIVAADFCLRSNADASGFLGHLGQGNVYPNTLAALIAETASIRQHYNPVGIIWAVHFPPKFPGAATSLELLNDANLINAASAQKVTVLLCGHTHIVKEYSPGIGVDVYCAGTATQYYAPDINAFHLRTITVNNGQVTACVSDNYRWDRAKNDFIPSLPVIGLVNRLAPVNPSA